MVVVSLLYLHFGVLAVVFFYVVSLKKTKKQLFQYVCVGQNQLYLLVVPDGNRRHFHLANVAGVWYILWFCGFLSPLLSFSLRFDSICTVFSSKDSSFFFIVNINRQCYRIRCNYSATNN